MNAAPHDASHAAEYPPVHETPWSPWRWFFWITTVFVLHIGLFLGLGNHKPSPPRPVTNAISQHPVLGHNEYLELQDPRVFAGPHRHGFAASTWLRPPNIPFPTFRWSDSPRLLALATDQLGTLLVNHPQTDQTPRREIEISPLPITTVLPPLPPPPAPTHSTLRLASNLADRTLENPTEPLPLQRAPDGLTNSIVQVTVDEAGRVFSPVLLPPGSGSREADQLALKIALETKFLPLGKTPRLTVGTLIFEWQVEPPTNNIRATSE